MIVGLLTNCCPDKAPKTVDFDVIEIGMSNEELDRVVLEHGCERPHVGIKVFPLKSLETHDVKYSWFIVPGNTCLRVGLSRLKTEGVFMIDSILKGPNGKGYPGKMEWMSYDLERVDRIHLQR